MCRLMVFCLALAAVVFPVSFTASSESGLAGTLLDYRNFFISYEQKGLDTCPFTYFRETCTDNAHVVVVETPGNDEGVEESICLGTFISEQFVLTTASCVASASPADLKLHANDVHEELFVESIFRHPDYKLAAATNNLALLKLNSTVTFNKKLAAACYWTSDSLDLYAKIQEISYDSSMKKAVQNTTICSGAHKTECLKATQEQWCQRKSSTGFLQIRQLGQHKMHPMIASFSCSEKNEIIPIAKDLLWIREVTKNTIIEYNFTHSGLGEKCFKNKHTSGVCLPIESCHQAFKDFKNIHKNLSVSQCGFDKTDIPLICCSTKDMLKGPETEALLRDIETEIEGCEMLYDEFRRTPEEHQLHSQVAIIDNHDSTNCTATLITARYLLTSAQCVVHLNIKTATVWLGLGNDVDNVVQRNVIHSTFPHPKFNSKSNHYNVAVIKLEYPVLIQSSSVPACLWSEKAKMPTDLSAVKFHQEAPSMVSASPMYYSDCRRLYNSDLTPSEMCVDYQASLYCDPKKHEDLCRQPGSGLFSNLYYGDDMKPVTYVVGIYNSGYQCDKGGPALYTRVSEYYEWIRSVVYLDSQKAE